MLPERFHHFNKESRNLEQILEGIKSAFAEIRSENKDAQIWYVAGIINSDGPEFVERNQNILRRYTLAVRLANPDAFVFSATDVFWDKELWAKLEKDAVGREDLFYKFWRDVFESGVNKVLLTPRWEESRGATREKKDALDLGIPVEEIDESVLLQRGDIF